MNLIDKVLKKIIFMKSKNQGNTEIKKVLFITLQFGLGDGVRTTDFIEALTERYQLDTLGNKNQKIINKYNPKIIEIFEYKCKKNGKVKKTIIGNLKLIFKLRKKKYDLIIDGSSSSSFFNLFFLRCLNSKRIYGFIHVNNKYKFKRITLYDKLFKNREELLKFLELKNHQKFIHLPVDIISEEIKKQSYELVFNTEGSNKFISSEKLVEILKLIEKNIEKNVKLIANKRRDEITKLLKKNQFDNIELLPSYSFYDVMYIIKKCEILISPDTSLIHVASVYNKKILGLYPNMEGFVESWGPESDDYEVVTPDVKTDNFDYLDKIDSKILLEALKKLIKKKDV